MFSIEVWESTIYKYDQWNFTSKYTYSVCFIIPLCNPILDLMLVLVIFVNDNTPNQIDVSCLIKYALSTNTKYSNFSVKFMSVHDTYC